MRTRRLQGAVVLFGVGALLVAGPAGAAKKTSLKLKVPGLTGGSILAVGATGSTVKAGVKGGTVNLRVPKSRVSGTSLHLTDRAGKYRGPVVLSSTGGKAYLVLGKGAAQRKSLALGAVKLSKGHASLKRKLPQGLLSTKAFAKAKKGVPIGAGRLGLQATPTSSRLLDSRALRAEGTIPGGTDPDRDGLPSNIDVDDNGNGILDNQDASQVPTADGIFAAMILRPSDSGVNVNATGVTDAQIDANMLSDYGFSVTFFFSLPPDQGQATGAWVDCGALPYCNAESGTALVGGLSESSADLPRGTPWRDYRPFGAPNGLELIRGFAWAMGLAPKATSAQLSPGDLYNVNFQRPGGIEVTSVALPAYPVTVPAVRTVQTGGVSTNILYGDPSGPGTNDGTAIPLSPSGDVSMVYWRPQRRAIPGTGEEGFIDMGRLHYTASVGSLRIPGGPGGGLIQVPYQREFTCDAEGNAIFPDGPQGASFFGPADPSNDGPPNPADTRTYTTNLRSCLNQGVAAGAFPGLGSVPAGSVLNIAFTASGEQRRGGADRAALQLSFGL